MPLLMDLAYNGKENCQQAEALGMCPVVPPLKRGRDSWEYGRELYKKQSKVERLFRRLKGYHRVFPRFCTLDVIFIGFIVFALNLRYAPLA